MWNTIRPVVDTQAFAPGSPLKNTSTRRKCSVGYMLRSLQQAHGVPSPMWGGSVFDLVIIFQSMCVPSIKHTIVWPNSRISLLNVTLQSQTVSEARKDMVTKWFSARGSFTAEQSRRCSAFKTLSATALPTSTSGWHGLNSLSNVRFCALAPIRGRQALPQKLVHNIKTIRQWTACRVSTWCFCATRIALLFFSKMKLPSRRWAPRPII